MELNWELCRIFYQVARCRNFSRAAAMLFTSQPAVSRSMAALERELGCRLFIRNRRGVELTPEGRMFYAHVEARCLVSVLCLQCTACRTRAQRCRIELTQRDHAFFLFVVRNVHGTVAADLQHAPHQIPSAEQRTDLQILGRVDAANRIPAMRALVNVFSERLHTTHTHQIRSHVKPPVILQLF